MPEPTASGKHGVLVMADLEGALDAVWRNAAIYKLQKAGLRNNLMSVFSSLLNDRQSRNLVNSSKCLAINFCEIQDLQTWFHPIFAIFRIFHPNFEHFSGSKFLQMHKIKFLHHNFPVSDD